MRQGAGSIPLDDAMPDGVLADSIPLEDMMPGGVLAGDIPADDGLAEGMPAEESGNLLQGLRDAASDKSAPVMAQASGDVPAAVSASAREEGARPYFQSSGSSAAASTGMTAVSFQRNALSNGMKVMLTILCTLIPGLGQLAGIIISIVFMNDQEDEDRRSFGIALLAASIVLFILASLFWFLVFVAFYSSRA